MKKRFLSALSIGLCMAVIACTPKITPLEDPTVKDPVMVPKEDDGRIKVPEDDGSGTTSGPVNPEDYSVEYNREELSILLPTLINKLVSTSNYKWEFVDYLYTYNYYHLEESKHENERPYTGTYENISEYIEKIPYAIPRDKFDSWLYTYFNLKVGDFSKFYDEYYVVESDSDYYYYYPGGGGGSLYESCAYIYDTSFAKDEAVFKADVYFDYAWNVKELTKKSRDEVLMDKDTEYLDSYELTFDTSDGKFLLVAAKVLEDEQPIRLLGFATDDKYNTLEKLKKDFVSGTEIPGYTYTEEPYVFSWKKDGWDIDYDYRGADAYTIGGTEDENTDKPILVDLYNYDYDYDFTDTKPETVLVGHVIFSDDSEILYYADGHIKITSVLKELAK